MAIGHEPLGDIATRVVFENEKVRIWNLIVEPGEASEWHLHDNDYVTIVVEGGGLTIEYDDGSSALNATKVGSWQFHGDHQPHRVINNSGERYTNVLVELKS